MSTKKLGGEGEIFQKTPRIKSSTFWLAAFKNETKDSKNAAPELQQKNPSLSSANTLQ